MDGEECGEVKKIIGYESYDTHTVMFCLETCLILESRTSGISEENEELIYLQYQLEILSVSSNCYQI